MITTNSINYSNLNKLHLVSNNQNSWLNVKSFDDNDELTHLYNNVCREFKNEKKWILLINPENETLENLHLQQDIDYSKILRVNTRKTNLNLAKIKSTLTQGNCSAVIICGTKLTADEVSQLSSSAYQGQTKCIVLKNTTTLH